MGKRSFAYGAATVQGAWPVQEDGYFIDPIAGRLVLGDGFGGKGRGDLATKFVLTEVKGKKLGLPRSQSIVESVVEWHQKLLQLNEKKAEKGGLSLLFAEVSETGMLALGGCGANAALLVRANRIQILLTPQAAPREMSGGVLFPLQGLGLGEKISVEARELQLLPGDILLLASSGCEWESEVFHSMLLGQLATRAVGESLQPLVSALLAGEAHYGLNRTLLALECNA